MYFLYIDESGSSGTRDKYRQFLVLIGVAIEDSQWLGVESRINALKQEYFETTEVELKSYNLRRRKSPFDRLPTEVYPQFLEAVSGLFKELPIEIVGVALDVRAYEAAHGQFDPYSVAYRKLLRLYGIFLAVNAERGILILDSRTGQLSQKADAQDNRIKIIHAQEKEFERSLAPLDLVNQTVLGEVFFVSSMDSFGIQLADLAAYAFFQRYERNDPAYVPYLILREKIFRTVDETGAVWEAFEEI